MTTRVPNTSYQLLAVNRGSLVGTWNLHHSSRPFSRDLINVSFFSAHAASSEPGLVFGAEKRDPNYISYRNFGFNWSSRSTMT